MEKSFKITFSDGTQLKDLALSGNNFISDKKITEKDFEGKLSKVTIEGKENGQDIKHEYEHMELVQIAKYDDGYYFILREKNQDEIDKEKMKGNIDYIAMMTNVEL